MAQDYKEEDEEIKESFDEYRNIQEQATKPSARNVISKLPREILIGLFVAIIYLIYLAFVKKTLDTSTFMMLMVTVVVLGIFLSAQEDRKHKQLIPEQQLKSVLYVKLKEKQMISPTEVPMGDIKVLLPCKLKKIEGFPIKYVMSFKITTTDGLEKYYTAEMNPYDGYLMGFEERPGGFRGTEVTDVSFIRHRQDVWADRYDFKGEKK